MNFTYCKTRLAVLFTYHDTMEYREKMRSNRPGTMNASALDLLAI